MNYLTLFEGKTPFNKLWLLLDLRAKLDLRLTKCLIFLPFYLAVPGIHRFEKSEKVYRSLKISFYVMLCYNNLKILQSAMIRYGEEILYRNYLFEKPPGDLPSENEVHIQNSTQSKEIEVYV